MKVMFINSVIDYGSTGKIVRDLTNELIESGHDVISVYGRNSAKFSENTFDIRDKVGFYWHYFMSRFFGRHGLHSKRATKRLLKEIKSFKPDVIHLHNAHGYYLHVPMLLEALKNMEIKILWTLHDTWLISGSSAYFSYAGCKRWDEGCVECMSTKDYPRADFIARQTKNFEWKKKYLLGFDNLTFITPSQWLKDVIGTSFLKDYPCEVVHNGIDLSLFHFQENAVLEARFKDKKVLLGVASIWEKRKGLEDFMKLDDMLDDQYQIVLIGLNQAQIASLPSSIIGIERTSDANELAAYYSRAYAYLNPTYEDNYPTTNIEARACLTPVIAYDTGGNNEVEGIICVKQGDIKALVQSLELIPDMKENHSVHQYSKEYFAEKMLPLYSID